MELLGRRCALTGNVLHLLKGEGLAGVTDLTLSHVPYAEVSTASLALLFGHIFLVLLFTG
jgi:hypothetical protein